jgi:hypothetical protein
VITAKDKNDPKLAELLRSIEEQDFPKDKMETLIITEGTSESAKAIGIRRAKGKIIGILASDNELNGLHFLSEVTRPLFELPWLTGSYPGNYYPKMGMDRLGKYFSLIGGNDPLSLYLGKNDRFPIGKWPGGLKRCGDYTIKYFSPNNTPSLGDNGFFIRKEVISQSDLDNYYHIDNPYDLVLEGYDAYAIVRQRIIHNTGGNIFSFFIKRYRYGLQHAFNKNRRWHLVDFSKWEDICKLIWFILVSVTFIEPLILSIRGYLKVRDIAWFVHPIMCFATVVTYGIMIVHLGLRRILQLPSVLLGGQRA